MIPFPPWTAKLGPLLPIAGLATGLYVVALVWYGGSPKTTDTGYAPEQPVPFSHALHAGELGMDCRYCHNTVERAAHAAIPPTETCMNCHERIHAESPKLAAVRESYASEEPIEWVRVHDLPDYVYFNHSAHLRVGVGCESCHGRIDTMERVTQVNTLSMGWCVECHRNPAPHLRPQNAITEMDWQPPGGDAVAFGERLKEAHHVNPSTDCSTCHR